LTDEIKDNSLRYGSSNRKMKCISCGTTEGVREIISPDDMTGRIKLFPICEKCIRREPLK
jgi:hypothetical protein